MNKEYLKNFFKKVVAGPNRCVDDRSGLGDDDKLLTPQMPGASNHPMDLMQYAVLKNGEVITEETLFEMTGKVYLDPKVRKYAKPGMHIDDDHKMIKGNSLNKRCNGCGQDSVRVAVMREMGVDVGNYNPGDRIREARNRGWNVQKLTGSHGGHNNLTPLATLNRIVGTTLDTEKLNVSGEAVSFNHDIWFVLLMLDAMVSQLKSRGYDSAASDLELNCENWSIDMYVKTLQHLKQSGEYININ